MGCRRSIELGYCDSMITPIGRFVVYVWFFVAGRNYSRTIVDLSWTGAESNQQIREIFE